MNALTTRIAARTLLIGGVFVLATLAAFMRGNSTGITFALENGTNLTIANVAFFNGASVPSSTWSLKDLVPGSDKFFNFGDIKPGDFGETTLTAHVSGRESAWLCLNFTNLQSNENGVIEPESDVDPNGTASGELANGVEFFAWRDNGNNIFDVGEEPLFGTSVQSASVVLNNKTYVIADSSTGPALSDGAERRVGIAWCAGNLSVVLSTADITCDGSALGNAAQSDSLSVDVAIQAASSRDNPTFLCTGNDEVNRGRPARQARDERPTREARPPAR